MSLLYLTKMSLLLPVFGPLRKPAELLPPKCHFYCRFLICYINLWNASPKMSLLLPVFN